MATVEQTEQEGAYEQRESVKIERNTRGYNWSIRVIREPGEDEDDMLDRVARIDRRLRLEYGHGM